MTRLSVNNIEHLETAIEYLIDEIPEVGLSNLGDLEELAAELLAKVQELNALHNLKRFSGGQ
jgi:superfamily I DNA and/or RNA helicase